MNEFQHRLDKLIQEAKEDNNKYKILTNTIIPIVDNLHIACHNTRDGLYSRIMSTDDDIAREYIEFVDEHNTLSLTNIYDKETVNNILEFFRKYCNDNNEEEFNDDIFILVDKHFKFNVEKYDTNLVVARSFYCYFEDNDMLYKNARLSIE